VTTEEPAAPSIEVPKPLADWLASHNDTHRRTAPHAEVRELHEFDGHYVAWVVQPNRSSVYGLSNCWLICDCWVAGRNTEMPSAHFYSTTECPAIAAVMAAQQTRIRTELKLRSQYYATVADAVYKDSVDPLSVLRVLTMTLDRRFIGHPYGAYVSPELLEGLGVADGNPERIRKAIDHLVNRGTATYEGDRLGVSEKRYLDLPRTL
jgi:hypothetical protein